MIAIERAEGSEAFAARLDAYFAARDHYLRAEIARHEGSLERAVEGYLASVRASRDFRTGYARLLALAWELATADRAAARRILVALEQAAPERPEARRMAELLGRPGTVP